MCECRWRRCKHRPCEGVCVWSRRACLCTHLVSLHLCTLIASEPDRGSPPSIDQGLTNGTRCCRRLKMSHVKRVTLSIVPGESCGLQTPVILMARLLFHGCGDKSQRPHPPSRTLGWIREAVAARQGAPSLFILC